MTPARTAEHRGRGRHRAQRGSVIVFVALALALMMGALALAIDVPNMYRVQTELRAGVDAAALAGASQLDGTVNGYPLAKQAAVDYANRHYAYNSDITITAGDVTLGNWSIDPNTGAFAFTANPGTMNPPDVNAVRVEHGITGVAMPFAGVLGTKPTTVGVDAVAVGGSPVIADCGFPLVIPDCGIQQAVASGSCDYCVRMQDATDDTGAWTTFTDKNGMPHVQTAVVEACGDSGNILIDSDGNCTGSCRDRTPLATDTIKVNGGNGLSNTNNNPCSTFLNLLRRDGAPKHFTVSVPVLATGKTAASCGDATLAGQELAVTGYTKLDIFGVSCGKQVEDKADAPSPSGSAHIDCNPASEKYLKVALHRDPDTGQCDQTVQDIPGGGPFGGTRARPRLVE